MPDISPAPASTIANCRYCDAFFDTAKSRVPGECPASGPQNARVHVPYKTARAEDRTAFDRKVSRLRVGAMALGYTLPGEEVSLLGYKTNWRLMFNGDEVSWLASQLEELQERREKENGLRLPLSSPLLVWRSDPNLGGKTIDWKATQEAVETAGDGERRNAEVDGDLAYGSACRFEFAYADNGTLRDVLRQLADKTDGAGINGRCTLCGSNRHPGTGWIFDENTETSIPPAGCTSPDCFSHKIREVLGHD